MKSSRSSVGEVTSLPSPAIQSVSVDRLLVAEMGADQVEVVHPRIVDVLARLHLRLDLLHHVALLDEVVGELDPGDLGERLGQGLGLVFMGGDGLGDDIDLHAGMSGLAALMNHCISFSLVFLRQRRRLELSVDPFLGGGLVGPRRARRRRGAPWRSPPASAAFSTRDCNMVFLPFLMTCRHCYLPRRAVRRRGIHTRRNTASA